MYVYVDLFPIFDTCRTHECFEDSIIKERLFNDVKYDVLYHNIIMILNNIKCSFVVDV